MPMKKWERDFYRRAVPQKMAAPSNKNEKMPEQENPQKTCVEPKRDTNNINDPDCPQLPGTFFRLNIKPGFVINLLNCIEISSPSGLCLIFRLLP